MHAVVGLCRKVPAQNGGDRQLVCAAGRSPTFLSPLPAVVLVLVEHLHCLRLGDDGGARLDCGAGRAVVVVLHSCNRVKADCFGLLCFRARSEAGYVWDSKPPCSWMSSRPHLFVEPPPGRGEEKRGTSSGCKDNAAVATAAAEGLTLVREAGTAFGYYGVSSSSKVRFKAQVRQSGQQGGVYLGTFDSPEGAALAIARRFPRLAEQRMAAAAQHREAAAGDLSVTMTAEHAAQIAEAEGLTLLVNPQTPCGYQGVHHKAKAHTKGFSAHLPGQKAAWYVGFFSTPHSAALAIARKLGPAGSAALAQERRNCAGWLITEMSEMSAPEARRLANEEGLTLRRSHGQPGKLWGVHQSTAVSERWTAAIRGVGAVDEAVTGAGPSSAAAATDGSTARSGRSLGVITSSGGLNLGSFASAEAAALALARRGPGLLSLTATLGRDPLTLTLLQP
jgi:hypothetical protein